MNFDVNEFLQAISEGSLCGEDLSFSNDFHEIKQAKTQDDILLDQGDWVTEPKQADWPFVAKKSTELLKTKTKDIRLLTWITEAWGHLYGFNGIENSLKLSHHILKQYWLPMYPLIDDDDLDQRLGLLQGLIIQLPTLIKQAPLTPAQSFYTLAEYGNRLYQQNALRKSGEESDSTKSKLLEEFEHGITSSSRAFQTEHYQSFENILHHWEELKQTLDTLMGLDAPSFANIDSQFTDMKVTLKKLYKIDATNAQQNHISEANTTSIQQPTEQSLLQEVAPIMTISSQYSFQTSPQNHIQNREQALKVLQQISEYFKENEPHSPVSYMLEKTIKWSQMPLHEWLNQVIKNDNPLENIQELLGTSKNSNESDNW